MRNLGAVSRILVVAVLTGLVALTTGVFGPAGLAQPPAGSLSLAKSASPSGGLGAGDTVTYTFVITNTGTTTVSGIGVREVSFTGSGGAPAVTCSPDMLQPGQSVTCSTTYDVTDADQEVCFIENSAIATGVDPASVESLPSSVRVLTDCADNLTGSAFLPAALGSSELGSLGVLAPLGLGSLGLGSLGSLGALGGLIGWALTTPYQPAPAAQCLNAPFPSVPFPSVPFLTAPCPDEQGPDVP
ncbi:DUF11 domain-containing protein [Prescottella defluvii]|uniref:DUF7507 domain-containing protein n=1 Tax=Prescottella defluvii TaxID=1323361 RepID=UPI0004F25E33|nr:DUF11 domain-containing protein [Prescottella defluvii]